MTAIFESDGTLSDKRFPFKIEYQISGIKKTEMVTIDDKDKIGPNTKFDIDVDLSLKKNY